jgi:hypothetical protein
MDYQWNSGGQSTLVSNISKYCDLTPVFLIVMTTTQTTRYLMI